MIRSVFVAGTAVAVLALGAITTTAGDAHPSALTHLLKSGAPAGKGSGGGLTTLAEGARLTATEAESEGRAAAQTQTPAPRQTRAQDQVQSQTESDNDAQDEDAADNGTGDNDTTENDD